MHDRSYLGAMMAERAARLGEAVRRRRTELGLRQTDLAELGGCSQRFVHTVEQGKPTLRLDKLLDVLEVLGLGLSVVPGRGEIEPPPEGPVGPAARG
jgi:y4mF family transcriptional regulator